MLLCAFLMLLSAKALYCQSEREYVKLIVSGVDNHEQAFAIDSLMRQQPGIVTSRMDRRTSIYLAIYSSGSGINIDQIRSWIGGLGFEPLCWVQGVLDGTPARDINRSTCFQEANDEQMK